MRISDFWTIALWLCGWIFGLKSGSVETMNCPLHPQQVLVLFCRGVNSTATKIVALSSVTVFYICWTCVSLAEPLLVVIYVLGSFFRLFDALVP